MPLFGLCGQRCRTDCSFNGATRDIGLSLPVVNALLQSVVRPEIIIALHFALAECVGGSMGGEPMHYIHDAVSLANGLYPLLYMVRADDVQYFPLVGDVEGITRLKELSAVLQEVARTHMDGGQGF